MKKCSLCKEEKPAIAFSPTSKNKNTGKQYYHSQCTACRVIYNREKYFGGRTSVKAKQTATHRECMLCHKMFLREDLQGSYCKPCYKAKYYDKEKAGEATKRYRSTHAARWRAMHRIHQFNRKNLIKATADGSVTDDVLKTLLDKEHCCWCNEKIAASKRTIEHIIELSAGGTHTKDNIDMACSSCNSSRKNKNVTS